MNPAPTRELALFDFDGTLTTRDTMLAFCHHVVGSVRYGLGLGVLAPMLVGYLLKVVPNDVAKVRMLTHFLGGRSRAELEAAAATFADRADGWLRPGAAERLAWHLEQGHDVLLVSASLDLWLAPWAERHGVRLVSTQGAFDADDRFTGGLATPNCHGPAKVERIRALVDPETYDVVHAYGDSSGDTEMLALAHHGHYRPFRT